MIFDAEITTCMIKCYREYKLTHIIEHRRIHCIQTLSEKRHTPKNLQEKDRAAPESHDVYNKIYKWTRARAQWPGRGTGRASGESGPGRASG